MRKEDEEEPASRTSDRRDAPDDVCEYCGTPVDTSNWHPVAKERDPAGSIHLYPFCSEDCRDAWLTDRPE